MRRGKFRLILRSAAVAATTRQTSCQLRTTLSHSAGLLEEHRPAGDPLVSLHSSAPRSYAPDSTADSFWRDSAQDYLQVGLLLQVLLLLPTILSWVPLKRVKCCTLLVLLRSGCPDYDRRPVNLSTTSPIPPDTSFQSRVEWRPTAAAAGPQRLTDCHSAAGGSQTDTRPCI